MVDFDKFKRQLSELKDIAEQAEVCGFLSPDQQDLANQAKNIVQEMEDDIRWHEIDKMLKKEAEV